MHNNPIIFNELKELNSILADLQPVNVYTVPEGYFEAMVGDVLHAIQPADQRPLNMNVPEGYFEGLAATILHTIKNDPSLNETPSLLQPLRSVNPYRVPQGYFDGLAERLTTTVISSSAVESEDSALLNLVKGINPYQVPPGYFDTLAAGISSKLHEPAKVIIMRKRSSFFNYAAAAVITGLLGLSVISIVDKRQQEQVLPVSPSTELNFDEALSSVSEDNIVAYLKQSGEDVNAALVASVTEDKNLPEQVDYLTDEKTLDNILNGLEVNSQTTTN